MKRWPVFPFLKKKLSMWHVHCKRHDVAFRKHDALYKCTVLYTQNALYTLSASRFAPRKSRPNRCAYSSIQIMDGYECGGTDIFMRWKMGRVACSVHATYAMFKQCSNSYAKDLSLDIERCVHGLEGHFLPPGVACTTGLSHNPFTWRPLKDGKKRLRQKVVLCNHM